MTVVADARRLIREVTRMARTAADKSSAVQAATALDYYVEGPPTPQAAVDIFKGEWASALPEASGAVAGSVPLFEDGRIDAARRRLGDLEGWDVLELGPLEGGHTWMLLNAGVAAVTAVEANTRAYLKCLVAKEILGMDRARYLLGDCCAFLEEQTRRWDLIVASGILYHMRDPVRLVNLMAAHTDRIVLWTHYYDATVIGANPVVVKQFGEEVRFDCAGAAVRGRRHFYRDDVASASFCGGSAPWSVWLHRQEILGLLERLGFGRVDVEAEEPDHPAGPAFLVVAQR